MFKEVVRQPAEESVEEYDSTGRVYRSPSCATILSEVNGQIGDRSWPDRSEHCAALFVSWGRKLPIDSANKPAGRTPYCCMR